MCCKMGSLSTFRSPSLTLKGPGGGRAESAPPDFFYYYSLAQLLALFSEKLGVRFQSYATLCHRTSAQNLEIFWICVQNIWKMAFCAKTQNKEIHKKFIKQ